MKLSKALWTIYSTANNEQALPSHTKLPTAREWTPRIVNHGVKASDSEDRNSKIIERGEEIVN